MLRDEAQAELAVRAPVNGGLRVPFTWWLAEDFAPVHAFGDRTLSRYRGMARKALGDGAVRAEPPPADPVRAVRDEVLAMFERVHLVHQRAVAGDCCDAARRPGRLPHRSGRLRQRAGWAKATENAAFYMPPEGLGWLGWRATPRMSSTKMLIRNAAWGLASTDPSHPKVRSIYKLRFDKS